MSHLSKSKKTTIYAIAEIDPDGSNTKNWSVEYNKALDLISVRANLNGTNTDEISFDISEAAARNLATAFYGIIDEVSQDRHNSLHD